MHDVDFECYPEEHCKKAPELLKKYNKEEFHIRHALTVEAVMRYFAKQKGYDEDFWGIVRIIT